jgi:HSP20 family protein
MKLISYKPFYSTRWADWMDDTDAFNKPSVNITEKDNGFYLELVSPGLAKEDFKIELKDKLLTISAEKKNEAEHKESEKVWKREYSFNAFKRSFFLPDTVEETAIEAEYEQGILKVYIPKKAELKPVVKTIEVN